MKTIAIILGSLLCCLLSSCGGKSETPRLTWVEKQIKASNDELETLDLYVQQYRQRPTEEHLLQIVEQYEKCKFEYSDAHESAENKKLYLQQSIKVEEVLQQTASLLAGAVARCKTEVVSKEDYLMNKGTEAFPLYAQKGDRIFFSTHSEQRFTLKVYNADSRSLLKTYRDQLQCNDSITVANSSIYLIELTPTANQYVDFQLQKSTSELTRLGKVEKIEKKTIDAQMGDFRSHSIKGVKMTRLLEEPRKFTLRGQFKAAFSGSARAVVALQVPKNAHDVLYSLRISTNEGNRDEDGDFYKNMNHSYHKVKFLGLPIYESTRSNGLLAQLLGDNIPLREEDAYINMFVFFDAAQARKFQDGKPTSELKYNVDYSTLGTQSCNGRIPAQGRKTIYLGFENERMRYNNYVWLEALCSQPSTEYVTEKYTLTAKDDDE